MAITKTTQAEKYYKRMRGAYSRLQQAIIEPEDYKKLGELIDTLEKFIGGGDNDKWEEFMPSYKPVWIRALMLKNNAPNHSGLKKFADNLHQVVSMSWFIQLEAPPTADDVCKQIWEHCGVILEKIDPVE